MKISTVLDQIDLGAMAAAVAGMQLRRLDERIAQANVCVEIVREYLADVPGVWMQEMEPGAVSAWWEPRIAYDPNALEWEGRRLGLAGAIVGALAVEGVECASTWQEVPDAAHKPWRNAGPWTASMLPNSARLLRDSFVIGAHQLPFWMQSTETAHLVGGALHKVLTQVPALAGATYQHHEAVPRLPAEVPAGLEELA